MKKPSAFLLLLLLFVLVPTTTKLHAQNMTSKYTVGPLPNVERFATMTSSEIDLDSTKYQDDNALLLKMLDGSAFVDGVSAQEKLDAIKYQKITAQRYRDNRSRYYVNLYINDQLDHERFAKVDTVTSQCDAYLNGNIIRIGMGVWGLGGFSFIMDIHEDDFSSAYWEDANQYPIYKNQLSEKDWQDNVLVDMKEQTLVLTSKPKFAIGEEISGYYTFKTQNYYRDTDPHAEDHQAKSKTTPETLRMDGVIYFKCKVRKKTEEDQ